MPTISISSPENPEDFDAIRQLCWEYRDLILGLGPKERRVVEHYYPKDVYSKVLDEIGTNHAPPLGAAKLARLDGNPVGCGMVQAFAPDAGEIKRVFVRETARGYSVGQKLCEALIEDCRTLGFNRVLLDTGRPLKAARALYQKLGFKERGPYQPIPEIAEDTLVFFELEL